MTLDLSILIATETCIEYAGWNRLYPEDYERYFAQMQKEYNTAISLYKTYYLIQKRISNDL